MAAPFFQRLRSYYSNVGAVLRGEANAASIFPNTTDIGSSRERLYAEFLRQHAPSKCNVFFGGFLFGSDGSESPQLDVLVVTDTTPRFNLHNQDGTGKSFSHVEGTLAVASIKSTLNKNELENALDGIARIPKTQSLDERVFTIKIKNYDDWPYKILYASDGIAPETLMQHLDNFYAKNPEIPLSRRPNIIHVSGKYVIFRSTDGMLLQGDGGSNKIVPQLGSFQLLTREPDLQGIVWVLDQLQQLATASTHILYLYSDLINQIYGLPANRDGA